MCVNNYSPIETYLLAIKALDKLRSLQNPLYETQEIDPSMGQDDGVDNAPEASNSYDPHPPEEAGSKHLKSSKKAEHAMCLDEVLHSD